MPGKNNISETIKEASFNTALGQVNRLNYLFDMATQSSTAIDPYGWYHALRALYREVHFKMGDEEREKVLSSFESVLPEINLNVQQNNLNGYKMEMPHHIYIALEDIETTLRLLADKAGLLTPSKKTFMDLLDEDKDDD